MNKNLYINFANLSTPKSQNSNLFQVFYKNYSSLAQILGLLALLFLSQSIIAQRPTINSFSPTNGLIGTSVTISGTGFNTTATQNLVFFGATRATVTAASATSLTVTVSTGATYQPISVLNTTNGLSGSSAKPFNVTFRGLINTTSFDPKDDFTTGAVPYSVSIGDLDGDGKPDLVVANGSSNTVSIFRNTSSVGSISASSFANKVDFTTGTSPFSVSIGDLDGDGKPDLAVANYNSNTVSIYRNTASAGSITASSFATKVDFTTGTNPASVSIGDLDGDGKPDLVVANLTSNTVSILRNTASVGSISASSFANKVDFTTGTSPRSVSIGDLDGDGKPDLAVANNNSATVSIFRNTASVGSITASSFANKVDFTTGTNPISVSIGDLDGDGKPDLAVANYNSTTVSIFQNTASAGSISASSFASKVDFRTGIGPISVSIGDLDGDGKPDLAVANNNSATVSILRNTASVGSITTNSFDSKLDFTTGTSPTSVSIGDLDGDGKPDLAVSNFIGDAVSILRNNPLLPTINSFSPSSGAIGSSVVITGTGFNTTAAQNIVFFGATMATVTAASATSLTVKVPKGATYQPISVLNAASGLSGSSDAPFNVTFRGLINATSFDPEVDFTTGTSPASVSIGDLDGDGKPDLAVANFNSTIISIFRNTSSAGSITASSFANKVDFTTGTDPISVSIGDLDGDGKPDLAVANYNSNTVSVFRNTASVGSITASSFASKVDFTTGLFPISVSIGDLDGDGKPDLVVANLTSNTVSILRNTSSVGSITASSFASKVDFTTGTSPRSVSVGDLDGDGKPDLAVANGNSSTVSIFRNTASVGSITASSFANKVDFTTGTAPISVSIGDLDGDGNPDLTTTNFSSNTVSILRNTASVGSITASSFASKVDFTTGANPYSVSMGDLDGDGKPDLAVANSGSSSISILRNTASAGSITTNSFASRVNFTTGKNPYSVSIGDLDGDSKPDLVVANANSTTVSILRNNPALPTINSFSPSSGAIGSSVVITGTGFNTTAAQNIVFFGATMATVTAASATSLTVTVPTGATYQPISVLNTTNGLSGSSAKPFNVTFRGLINATSFDPKDNFTTGANPSSVSIGDLDGDGKPDLAVANFNSTIISIFRNTSSAGSITASSFANKVDFTTGTDPISVSIGDLDGDGKPDLAVVNNGSNSISVFRNTASAGSITASSFASKVDFTTGTGPYSVSIGDLDSNGKPDLAVTNGGSSTVSIFRNTASVGSITASSFASKVDFATGSFPISVSIGDLDGDGKPDLAVPNSFSSTVSIFRNTASVGSITASSFANKVDFTTGSFPVSVSIGDLDGDGKPDLAVTNDGSSTVSIFRNTASVGSITASSFASKVDFTTGASPRSVSIGDLDGDGKPDLAVANNNSATVSILRNTASVGSITTGSFANKVDFTTGTDPYSVSIGDLDGDSKPDLAVANFSSSTVSILRNNPLLPPIINAFSPSSGEIGSSVIITGTGFSSSATQNIVYFGATMATVTAASATSLTVTVPMGATYQHITVLNTATNWVGSSTKPFNVTFEGIITPASLNTKVDFTTGTNPISVSIGDLDGDGKPDLAVVNNSSSSNTISVFRNTSSVGSTTASSFASKVDFTTGANPRSVSIGDLDGDGKPDLAVANFNSNTVSIFRNTASVGSITTSSFANKVDFTTGTNPSSASIGDLDGDGKPDLAVANYSNFTVSIHRNTASVGSITASSFASKVDFTTGAYPISVSMGDLDDDGKPDLAVTNSGSATVSILRNTASVGSITASSFASKVDFTTGANPRSVGIGDLDGDGKPDLVVNNFGSNTVSIFQNTASVGSIIASSFASKVDFTTGTNPRSVSMGDLDGDGKPDLAVADGGSNTVSIFQNTASVGSITTNSFASKVDFTTGTNPISVSIGDLDGDGKPDLAVANLSSNTVSILRQISTASSIVSGNWENATTWKNGLIPQIGDLVIINPNHTVTLNSIGDAKYLRFKPNAQLQYGNTTAQLKIGF